MESNSRVDSAMCNSLNYDCSLGCLHEPMAKEKQYEATRRCKYCKIVNVSKGNTDTEKAFKCDMVVRERDLFILFRIFPPVAIVFGSRQVLFGRCSLHSALCAIVFHLAFAAMGPLDTRWPQAMTNFIACNFTVFCVVSVLLWGRFHFVRKLDNRTSNNNNMRIQCI